MATEERAPDLTVDVELADKAFTELRDHGTWLIESEPKNYWFAPLLVHLILFSGSSGESVGDWWAQRWG